MLRRFGERLRACRVAAKNYETAGAFAAAMGIEQARYTRYERGESLPPLDVLKDICVVRTTDADFLLFGWPDHKPPT